MKQINFNQGWKFQKKGENKVYPVTLPHDAMIYEKRIPKLAGGETSGYFPGGKYIYKKTFSVEQEGNTETLLLDFDGVHQKSTVYLNEKKVGGHIYGYSHFYVDISKEIQYGSENVLKVEVDNTQVPNSRWYTGSGIYREVKLWRGGERYLVPDGIRIHTISYSPAVIEVSVEVRGTQKVAEETVSFEILENEKKKESIQILKTSVKEEEKGSVYTCQIQLEEAKLWSGEEPNLYRLKATLTDGSEAMDEAEESFGIHHLAWNAQEGLVCNGNEVKLRGACIHHDNGILGAAEYKEAVYRKIRILKETGYNAVRTAHNPPSRFMLQACDELGMYMMAEFTDVWSISKNPYDYSLYFKEEWEKDVRAMVRKLYSHPCVVMYSIGNEITDGVYKKGFPINKMLADLFHELDGTRPVTNCINILEAARRPKRRALKRLRHTPEEMVDPSRVGKDMPLVGSKLMNVVAASLPKMMLKVTPKQLETNLAGLWETLDLAGLNYGTHLSETVHEYNPDRLVVHSETYPSYIGRTWPITEKCKHVIGDFMWTGWDYLGETGLGVAQYGDESMKISKPYPCISGGVGSVNLIGEVEAQGEYTKTVFGKSKKPYIGVRPVQHSGEKYKVSQWRGTDVVSSWTWKGCEGRKAEVQVYSDAVEVELIQDGKSLGRKAVTECKAEFETVYQPGSLEAVAYDKNGNCVGESRLETAQEEMFLQLIPERQGICADGEDITYIHIAVTDQNGIVKVLEEQTIHVEVEGAAELLAVGSGSPMPTESYVGDTFTTYYGTMAVVVRSNGQTGEIKVTCSTKDGLKNSIVLNAE